MNHFSWTLHILRNKLRISLSMTIKNMRYRCANTSRKRVRKSINIESNIFGTSAMSIATDRRPVYVPMQQKLKLVISGQF